MEKLRIAQVGSIWETTPPKLYGGTERIVSSLTEKLVELGQEVTLFATGNSKTKAKLVSIVDKPLYEQGISWANMTFPLLHLHEACEMRDKFDIYHFHLNFTTDYMALAFSKLLKLPSIFTFHLRLPLPDGPDWEKAYVLEKFKDANYVSISNSQRKIKSLNYARTVYNGIELANYTFSAKGGESLFWLGRVSKEKGTKEAIEVALLNDKSINLAGKIEHNDPIPAEYYNKEIKPVLEKEKDKVKYIGELDDKGKSHYLGQSKCLVNTINWDEPFGLVVAEANACGTPVVAFNRGAMSEIIKEGVNGFLVEPGDVKGAADKIKQIYAMEDSDYLQLRISCRNFVEHNFSSDRMASQYLELYHQILKSK